MGKFHTNTHGTDAAAFQRGFLKLIALAKANNHIAFIAVYTKGALYNISTSLGDVVFRDLHKNKVAVVNGITLHLITERISPSVTVGGPVFVTYANFDLLNLVTEHPLTTDTIFLPWMETELKKYLTFNPKSIAI